MHWIIIITKAVRSKRRMPRGWRNRENMEEETAGGQ